jgi:hypothetical protein
MAASALEESAPAPATVAINSQNSRLFISSPFGELRSNRSVKAQKISFEPNWRILSEPKAVIFPDRAEPRALHTASSISLLRLTESFQIHSLT